MTDDAAFDRFVRDHTTTLFHTAFLLTGNRHEAEELLQDTLAHLYPKWSVVASADSPLAYVRRSLANRFLSGRRSPAVRLRGRWELPDRWDGADLEESIATSRTVWQLLGGLPERQRAALVMRYFHDLPEAEVAAALGCRPSSVRSLVSRGITAMRAAYSLDATSEGSR